MIDLNMKCGWLNVVGFVFLSLLFFLYFGIFKIVKKFTTVQILLDRGLPYYMQCIAFHNVQ